MGTRDPRVDAYIARSADFARPILTHLRDVVHAACPAAEETIKWGMPFFAYDGGLLANMASFKAHCAFGFWKGRGVVGDGAADDAMGQFGRITSLADLPSRRTMEKYVKEAMKARAGAAAAPPRKKAPPRAALPLPPELDAALATPKHRKAKAFFDALPPSHRREYIEWITDAKRPDTRAKRLATTLEWLTEGKSRNWKYERR